MSEALYVVGDVRKTLAALPDSSVDLVLTSPPFLALRSYLPADDPEKPNEIGQEATPGAFLDVLLDVTEDLARVLKPEGSLCFELGDTYSGSGGAGGDYNPDGLRDGQEKFSGSNSRRGKIVDHDSGRRTPDDGWPLAKSLCLIPELFRIALAYGRNPLTGRETDPWRVRNVVRWCRPNPPVGALGDKFRPGTSDLVVACKSGARWFDLDAVREPAQVQMGREVSGNNIKGSDEQSHRFDKRIDSNPNGAPPLDWWEIPTAPYKGSHYATFPPALCVRPVKAMCPAEVCRKCGKGRRRIAETTNAVGRAVGRASWDDGTDGIGAGHSGEIGVHASDASVPDVAERRTLGWSDCGCGAGFRPGVVLDPFAGSGTTLQVATGHGRNAIGIDLDKRNASLASERVGMWLREASPEGAAEWLMGLSGSTNTSSPAGRMGSENDSDQGAAQTAPGHGPATSVEGAEA